MQSNRRKNLDPCPYLPQLVIIVMLLVAREKMPYGYYQLLRWATCGVFGYLAYTALEKEKKVLALLLAVVAVVYNPFIPFKMQRHEWETVNLATAAFAAVSVVWLPRKA